MRTTVNLDAELLEAARSRARDRGLTLGEVLEDALRRSLSADRPDVSGPEVPLVTYGSGLRPGVDLSSNRSIAEILDDGLDLDQLR